MGVVDRFEWYDKFRTDAPDRRPVEEQWANPRPYIVQGPNHWLHFALTLLTAGLWLPVWIIVAINNQQRIRYL